MAEISARKIERKYIEVTGVIGEFNIPNKKYQIKFFSTTVSNRDNKSDSYSLLEELKPVRERVKARNIKDLNSLMQRDLNDIRVIDELIPYLISDKNPIAFFPAILCVLMPKGFLENEEEAKYPVPHVFSEEGNNTISSYNDDWKLETFKIGGSESNLGILMIDSKKVDIVVLDGQHRTSAFKAITGSLPKEESIYSAFYSTSPKLGTINADLPVTIIWFESKEEKFDPKIISRKLFVDVNNTSKKVSKSRTILLDEFNLTSLMTRFFYSHIAKVNSFATREISLLHSSFDIDSDMDSSNYNHFSITNPQILNEVFYWLCFGSRVYDYLNRYSVSRERGLYSLSAFGSIFGSSIDQRNIFIPDDAHTATLTDESNIVILEEAFKKILLKPFYHIYNYFPLHQIHFQACEEVEKTYDKMTHLQQVVWDEVFMGGEGLYYILTDEKNRNKDRKAITGYASAISTLEDLLKETRYKLLNGCSPKAVDSAYKSARTKAFQVGMFMALNLYRDSNSIEESYDDFCNKLIKVSSESWVIILTDIRRELIEGTSPKVWPAYQKIILRVIQENNKYYSSDNFSELPDGIIYRRIIEDRYNNWISENEIPDSIEQLEKDFFKKWISEGKEKVEGLFIKAKIRLLENVDYYSFTKEIISSLLLKD